MGVNDSLHCSLGTGPSLSLRSALLHNLRHVKAHKLHPFVHTHTHTHTHTHIFMWAHREAETLSRTQPYKQPCCGFITMKTDTHTHTDVCVHILMHGQTGTLLATQ